MKKKLFIAAFILFVAFVQVSASRRMVDNDFYRVLNRYGKWIEIKHDYFVWHPTVVARNWEPYSIGKWYWTDTGWFWDSQESFIWITHNYGEWYYDRYYGWIWYPTSELTIPRRRPFYRPRPAHVYRKTVRPIVHNGKYKYRRHAHNYVVEYQESRVRNRCEPYPVRRIGKRRPR